MQENNEIIVELSEPQTTVLSVRKSIILDMAGKGSGKSQNIGYSSGMFISDFPQALGFIAANTAMQLSQSTLNRTFEVWKNVYGFTEYDAKSNPAGSYVVDKRPPLHFERIHRLRDYAGTISFYNGTLIYIGSLENYKAHDGKQFAWAHLDETKDTDENALREVIIGRLRQYGLWFNTDTADVYFDSSLTPEEAEERGLEAWNPLYIHTSPALGGVKWLNEMFKLSNFQKEIKRDVLKGAGGFFFKEYENKAVIIYSTYHNEKNLPPNYIENQKVSLMFDDAILRDIYGFPFGKSGGEFYPTFRRDIHTAPVEFIPGKAVHITWDFNSVPYMTCLLSQVVYITRYIDQVGNKYAAPGVGLRPFEVMQIRFYKEYCFGKFGEEGTAQLNSTESICQQFEAEHDPIESEVYYYGDASGAANIPGMGSITNFKIIAEKLFRFIHNYSNRVRVPNVGVNARRKLINKILGGQIPGVELVFDESMKFTIDDFEQVKEGPDGKVKAKAKDPDTQKLYELVGHCTDAVEYEVCELCREYLTT